MNPGLRAVASTQGGLFTRRQAVESGCTERELKTRTGARGDWAVVRRGVYCERTLLEAANLDERYRLRVRAAVLAATKPAVVSHASAAAHLEIPLSPHWTTLVHVTRPGVTGSRTEGGVKHHLAAYTDGRDRGGVADVPPEQVLWEEKRREDWLRNHDGGYGMSRVVWSELLGAVPRGDQAPAAPRVQPVAEPLRPPGLTPLTRRAARPRPRDWSL